MKTLGSTASRNSGPQGAELFIKLLETVVPTNVVSLPLKQVNNTIYATAVDQDRYLTNTRMYLAVAADASDDEEETEDDCSRFKHRIFPFVNWNASKGSSER